MSRAPHYHYLNLYLNQGALLACNRWHESLHMIASYPFMYSYKCTIKRKCVYLWGEIWSLPLSIHMKFRASKHYIFNKPSLFLLLNHKQKHLSLEKIFSQLYPLATWTFLHNITCPTIVSQQGPRGTSAGWTKKGGPVVFPERESLYALIMLASHRVILAFTSFSSSI